MNSTAVYTCITNSYDVLRDPKVINKGVDYICFTDDDTLESKVWEIRLLKGQSKIPKNKRQREVKILAHKYLSEYKRTIWIDANIQIIRNLSTLIDKYRGSFIALKHPTRNCIYEEGLAILRAKKASKKAINEQVATYYDEEFDPGQGLYDTKFLIRDNNERINKLCDEWWKEVSERSHRDQMSLPIVLKRNNIKATVIPTQMFYTHVKAWPHKVKKPPKIHYISPFRSDKNIGLANNDEIAKYDHKDWVCLTDADSMPLLPDYGKQIEEIIMEHGHEYGLIGCVTNRLGGLHQCWEGKFSDEMDIRKHYEIAVEARKKYGNSVEPTTGVAGLMMIFSVELWKRIGGFVEKDIKADTLFNKAVKHKGLKIGIAKGLYLFHAYRIHKEGHKEAWNSIEHLK